MNTPILSASLDFTKSGVDSVVICERGNYQGTETGPIAGDTEILVALSGLTIILTLDQLADLARKLADGMLALPEKRRRDHEFWNDYRARKAGEALTCADCNTVAPEGELIMIADPGNSRLICFTCATERLARQAQG